MSHVAARAMNNFKTALGWYKNVVVMERSEERWTVCADSRANTRLLVSLRISQNEDRVDGRLV